MIRTDTLTSEEVERLDPETRRYYSGANSRDESMWPTVLIVSRAWLRDHITRAARMEAFVRLVTDGACTCPECFELIREDAKALAPTERSK